MKFCVFECEDFPKENQMQANKKLTLVKSKTAIFYILCWQPFFNQILNFKIKYYVQIHSFFKSFSAFKSVRFLAFTIFADAFICNNFNCSFNSATESL